MKVDVPKFSHVSKAGKNDETSLFGMRAASAHFFPQPYEDESYVRADMSPSGYLRPRPVLPANGRRRDRGRKGNQARGFGKHFGLKVAKPSPKKRKEAPKTR